ncbi:MAG: hypothetical protein RQ899_00685 [Pseudomonadales bacterium]|nr:hypothetical protein [Pseudomonadales bacterium]
MNMKKALKTMRVRGLAWTVPWSRRVAGAILGLAALMTAPFVPAASEFEDVVPIDLVRLMLGFAPGEEGGIYRDIPEDFPVNSAPAGFRVLGAVGAANQPFRQRLYLETDLGEGAAVAAMEAALGQEGWVHLSVPPTQAQAGFLDPPGQTLPPFPEQFCHDEHDNLQMTFQDSGGGNLVTLRRSLSPVSGSFQTCQEQAEARLQTTVTRRIQGNGLAELMPRLELPREADFGGRHAGPTGGISTLGRNETRTRTGLAIDWEAERVYAHFEAQLTAQEWSQQDGWRNAVTAGGVWARSTEDDTELRGVLTILSSGDGRYILEFRLVSL